jgi:hypothetical protein
MKSLLKRKLASTDFGDLYTPFYATELIVPYLHGTIWECAAGEGHITSVLEAHGMNVIETDIAIGSDFFDTQLPNGADFIVTNPPYKLKDKFLQRCYDLGVPFALLLPITALGGMKRSKMFRDYGVEILVPDTRINFIYPNAGKSSWFHSAWFCHNVLPSPLIFAEMKKY